MNPDTAVPAPNRQIKTTPVVSAAETRDPVLDGLARLAASVCQAHVASIVRTGYGEIWCGPEGVLPATAVSRNDPFFNYTARTSGLFEVADAALDERFRDAEWVTGSFAIRSYTGCALLNAAGDTLGIVAVYGTAARRLSHHQRSLLMLLAEQGVAHIELRARVAELALFAATS